MLNKVLKILFVISIFLLIIFGNFKLYSLNFNFYKKEFLKLNIYDKIPEADKHVLNLINYFKDKEELNNFFNEKEKLHLRDVKNLINIAFIIFYISLILFLIILIYFIYKKEYLIIKSSLMISSVIVIFLLLLSTLINFDSFFINFHKIFFNNNLWLLNPETDNLINLFPEQFFYDISLKIWVNSLLTSLFLMITSYFALNKRFLNKH